MTTQVGYKLSHRYYNKFWHCTYYNYTSIMQPKWHPNIPLCFAIHLYNGIYIRYCFNHRMVTLVAWLTLVSEAN